MKCEKIWDACFHFYILIILTCVTSKVKKDSIKCKINTYVFSDLSAQITQYFSFYEVLILKAVGGILQLEDVYTHWLGISFIISNRNSKMSLNFHDRLTAYLQYQCKPGNLENYCYKNEHDSFYDNDFGFNTKTKIKIYRVSLCSLIT